MTEIKTTQTHIEEVEKAMNVLANQPGGYMWTTELKNGDLTFGKTTPDGSHIEGRISKTSRQKNAHT